MNHPNVSGLATFVQGQFIKRRGVKICFTGENEHKTQEKKRKEKKTSNPASIGEMSQTSHFMADTDSIISGMEMFKYLLKRSYFIFVFLFVFLIKEHCVSRINIILY